MTLSIREVSKFYSGGILANDRISLEIQAGEVFGLLGPNGAGKTTLVHQVIGLLRPTGGEILIDDVDVVRDPASSRRLCSYLPQGNLPIDALPVGQAIELIGRIRGGTRRGVRRSSEKLLQALEIDEWRSKLGSQLSGGVRRLVGFVMAAVVPGRLVILDEPTNDVDPLRRRRLWEQIRKLATEGAAVLLVTHNVLEAERSVDRLAILDRGRLLAQGTPASLQSSDRRELRFELTMEPSIDAPALPSFCRLRARTGRRLLSSLYEEDAPQALAWAQCLKGEHLVEDFELGPVSLEDTYLRVHGRSETIP
ncbi:MAG: ABC transporter ATP-binding protein [Vicinamibacteria bacterium]